MQIGILEVIHTTVIIFTIVIFNLNDWIAYILPRSCLKKLQQISAKNNKTQKVEKQRNR